MLTVDEVQEFIAGIKYLPGWSFEFQSSDCELREDEDPAFAQMWLERTCIMRVSLESPIPGEPGVLSFDTAIHLEFLGREHLDHMVQYAIRRIYYDISERCLVLP